MDAKSIVFFVGSSLTDLYCETINTRKTDTAASDSFSFSVVYICCNLSLTAGGM